ncbi:hypothetical protein [Allomuricauda sp. d1]|uniref:tetratricopeptide repeat protein n=1 Tax=Allomuricauda sp. d1 TaxID=3136725 RepID=UPI0031CF605C
MFLYSLILASSNLLAQEDPKIIEQEESAEVFLEAYTDEFQETFFEALKQKGIQNYDRASNLLLKCKQLQPENTAVDHELAKVNLKDKQYYTAQGYAIEAVVSEPENYWFLNTLSEVLQAQGDTFESVKGRIPYENEDLRYNLATIKFKQKKYDAALNVLKGLKKTESIDQMIRKIEDSLQKNTKTVSITVENSPPEDPIAFLKQKMDLLIRASNFLQLQTVSEEAVETYPLQPYFYYSHGLALNKRKSFREATKVLENGLDYVFDDPKLAKKFYDELVIAYTGIGNTVKANEYLRKSKIGL